MSWAAPRLAFTRRIRPRYIVYAVAISALLWTLYYSRRFRQRRAVEMPWSHPSMWTDRALQVRDSFRHAYHGYETHAAPYDELKPISNQSTNTINGWGLTAIDSLDTMFLMGLDEEFKRGIELVERTNLTEPRNPTVMFFETVIRYLGGFLSAYALSHEPLFLTKADQLATLLDPVFNTTSGFPAFAVDINTGRMTRPNYGILSEIGSFQLEYAYLAKLTGNKTYFDRVWNTMENFAQADARSTGGLLPIGWNLDKGQPYDTRLSAGAEADSAHEYFLKYFLLTAQTDKRSLELYIRATTRILTHLMFITPHRHLLYVTKFDGLSTKPTHQFEHLACFLPGLFALGAHILPLDRLSDLGIDLIELSKGMDEDASKGYKTLAKYDLRELHMWAADGLAETCYITYADQASGIGPDELWMTSETDFQGQWIDVLERWKEGGARGPPPGTGPKVPIKFDPEGDSAQKNLQDYTFKRWDHLLRPETVESLYLLWRTSRDDRWREYGWEIYQALESQSKTASGYACLSRVDMNPALQFDEMPSYFMAETLKYLYLLFYENDLVPLDKWVFNTEAHPLPIFEWSATERKAFGI